MNLLKQILWGGLAFILTLLFCEAFIWSSNIANLSFSDFDPEIGKVNRKNIPYLIFNEGMGVGHFNEHAYLHKAYPPERKANSLRFALMGDSYVAGMQVMERHHFRSLLEQRLDEQSDKEVELLNFGRAGFDMADVYALKKTFVSRFNPDYYLVFVAGFDFFPQKTDILVPTPYLDGDSLRLNLDFPKDEVDTYNKVKVLPQHSTILNMLNNGLKKTKQVPIGSIIFDKFYTLFHPAPSTSEGELVEDKEVSAIVKAIIKDLDPEKVIFINRDRYPLPSQARKLLEPYHFIDLSVALSAMEEAGESPIEWPITNRVGHWNHIGHQKVAEILEEELDKYVK